MPAKGWIEVSDAYCKGCELCIKLMMKLIPRAYAG